MKKIFLIIYISMFCVNLFPQEVLSVEKIETIITQTKYPFGLGTAMSKENAEKMAIEDLEIQLMVQLNNQIKVNKMLGQAKTGIVSSKGFYEIIAYIENGNIVTEVTTTTTETVTTIPANPNPEMPKMPVPIKPKLKVEVNEIIEDLFSSESEEILNQKLSNYSDNSTIAWTDKWRFAKDDLEQRYIVVIQNNKIIAFLSPYNNSRYDYISKTQISDIQKEYYNNPDNKFTYINILKK